MREIQISRRLRAVAGLVKENGPLADVGCDHGYIPIYLIQKGKIPRAIAMDVNQGPLDRARVHIREWGLEKYIETRLSDGLAALFAGEADTIVIAGMGGPLMERILTEGQKALTQVKELVLQPQSEIGHFREFLAREGYCIRAEDMVEEDGKYYPMMRAVPGKMKYNSRAEYLYGRELLTACHPVLYDFLLREQAKAEEILLRLEAADSLSAAERKEEIQQEIRDRKEALAYYER